MLLGGQNVSMFAGMRSPSWQSYGGVAPDGHAFFSPAASSHQQWVDNSSSVGVGENASSTRGPASFQGGVAAAEKAKLSGIGNTPTVHEHLELIPRSEWVRDDDAIECQGEDCDAVFGIFIRRHHCRACGGIYCGDCSTNRLRLEQRPSRIARRRPPPAAAAAVMHRVCDECYGAATLQ